jgi:hypothetical protein
MLGLPVPAELGLVQQPPQQDNVHAASTSAAPFSADAPKASPSLVPASVLRSRPAFNLPPPVNQPQEAPRAQEESGADVDANEEEIDI